MSVVPSIGSTCLGIVIFCVSWYFVRRFDSFTPATLSTIIALVLGGVATEFLSRDESVLWFYPIGLFLGLVGYAVASFMVTRGEELSLKDRMGYLVLKK